MTHYIPATDSELQNLPVCPICKNKVTRLDYHLQAHKDMKAAELRNAGAPEEAITVIIADLK